MSISGISSNSISSYLFQASNDSLSCSQLSNFELSSTDASENNSSSTIDVDLNLLLKALESGNLSSAQSSFSQLLQDLQSTDLEGGSSSSAASTSSATTDSNPLAKDLNELGNAISSGDLTSAQSILAGIMQHLQGPPPPPPPDMNISANTDSADVISSENSSNVLANDLKGLGEALSSGDQASATSYFSQLLQDLGEAGSTDSSGSSTASIDTTSSQFNMLLQNFLQILSSLTDANSKVSTTDTVA
ncbi:MAG: hypothetical protein ABFD50_02990 [Smithella sp.]